MVKILIFTAPYGNGHRSASDAVSDYIKENYKGYIEVRVIDYFETLTPVLARFAAWLYKKLIQYWPTGWRLFFNLTNLLSHTAIFQPVNLIGLAKARSFLKAYKPDIVLSLYPLCEQVASALKREFNYFSAVVITDFGAHNQWVHPDTDLYFAAADKVKEDIINLGVPHERIEVTGIPVRMPFRLMTSRDVMRGKYRLQDCFTILLTSGGDGMNWMKTLCQNLAILPVKLLVLCGTNKGLFTKIKKLSHAFSNIHPFNYAAPEIMAELMTASDLMIGKAGGLTVSEALCKGLPMLFYRPTPGQEDYNVEFLINKGAAMLTKDLNDIITKTKSLIKQPDYLKELKANTIPLGKPSASEEICKRLLSRWLEDSSLFLKSRR
jgi:processive 1,2-diacylglycerol beta-glucosyltransferase